MNEDTERMDWLEKRGYDFSHDGNGIELTYLGDHADEWCAATGKTLREAVDRAMHPEDFA